MTQRDRRLLLGFSTGIVLAMVGAYLFFTLSNASYTLGCDYLAYDAAARRWLVGGAPYDLSITQTGSCGTYQYPPAFLLAIAPLTWLSPEAATWVWIGICVVCLFGAVALMPAPFEVRLVTLALAGTSWPMMFAIKVGALGPLLLLVFVLAWRWLDRPLRLALSVGIGALVKLQPALLLLWMALTGRWRAMLMTIGIGAVVLTAGFLLDGRSWLDFFTVTRTLSGSALAVPANFAPASIAYYAGASEGLAQAIGVAHTLGVLILVVIASRRADGDASLLVTAVASQIVSPVMWDHYIVVLFLPIAWLLARRQYWVLAIGVAVNAMFVLLVPPILYVVAMDAVMVAVTWVGWTRSAVREPAVLRQVAPLP